MVKYTQNDYRGKRKPTWCAGCGDYSILRALIMSFEDLQYDPKDTAVVAGIGCSSRFPFFMGTYGLHSIHGRALPTAIGLKEARPDVNVVVVGGDGDGLSIGGNHFIHASRKNPDITYILMDNEIYALTKGQCSPTSREGTVTKCNPYAWTADRINPVLMALSFNATYIARGYAGDIKQLHELIKGGLEHKGFSFIHVLSPCVQYNKISTFDYLKEIIKPVPQTHKKEDRLGAMELAMSDDGVYTGLLYEILKPTYEQRYQNIVEIAKLKAGKNCNVKDIMKQFI